MARHTIAGRSTVVGTNVRAQFSLFATAAVRPRILEIGVSNTTATAVALAVVRFTNATGVGAGLTEAYVDDDVHTPIATGFAGHTADGGVGGVLRQASLGAAIGAGYIWTFSGSGLEIPAGTANGVGVTVPTGTGQITDYWLEWEE